MRINNMKAHSPLARSPSTMQRLAESRRIYRDANNSTGSTGGLGAGGYADAGERKEQTDDSARAGGDGWLGNRHWILHALHAEDEPSKSATMTTRVLRQRHHRYLARFHAEFSLVSLESAICCPPGRICRADLSSSRHQCILKLDFHPSALQCLLRCP